MAEKAEDVAGVAKEEVGVAKEESINKMEPFENEIKRFSQSDRRILRQTKRAIDEISNDPSLSEQEKKRKLAEIVFGNMDRLSPEARAFLYEEMGRLGINMSELKLLFEKKQQGGERKGNEEVLLRTQRGPAPAQAPKIPPEKGDKTKDDRSARRREEERKRRSEGLSKKKAETDAQLSHQMGNISRTKNRIKKEKQAADKQKAAEEEEKRKADQKKADKEGEKQKADEKREKNERESTQQTEV